MTSDPSNSESKSQPVSGVADDPLEKTTARHPYSIYIIGTIAFFVLVLLIGYFGTESDWVLKQR